MEVAFQEVLFSGYLSFTEGHFLLEEYYRRHPSLRGGVVVAHWFLNSDSLVGVKAPDVRVQSAYEWLLETPVAG